MMTAERTVDWLEEDRTWLEVQPGLSPWPEGRAMLVRQLQQWTVEYSERLYAAPVRAEDPRTPHLCRRLWECWRHHWQQAREVASDGKADGQEVARRIRSGEGYAGGKRLGGDPLADVMLAEAVLARDTKATEYLEEQYRPFCVAQGRGIDRRIDEDAHDWWCQLLDRLAGYSRSPGKLASFSGRCGLKFWLGRVARNFAHDSVRPQDDPRESETEREAPPSQDADVGDCLQLLGGFVRQGLEDLPNDDRLLLCLLLVDELPGKDVAEVFGIVPGNVSRRRAKAETRLRQRLQEAAAQRNTSDVGDCLELVSQHRNWQHFAGVFCDALRQVRPDVAPCSMETRP
jgi:RNA polymerase sigma factor (sigma-70 family)